MRFDLTLCIFAASDVSRNRKAELAGWRRTPRGRPFEEADCCGTCRARQTHGDQPFIRERLPIALQCFKILKIDGLRIRHVLETSRMTSGAECPSPAMRGYPPRHAPASHVVTIVMDRSDAGIQRLGGSKPSPWYMSSGVIAAAQRRRCREISLIRFLACETAQTGYSTCANESRRAPEARSCAAHQRLSRPAPSALSRRRLSHRS